MSHVSTKLKRLTAIPLTALKVSSRRILANHLNPPKESLSNDGYLQDKEGLAELLGYMYTEIQNYKLRDNFTMALLDDWSQKQGSTISVLWGCIEQLERHDILQDEILMNRIDKDAQSYQHEIKLRNEACSPAIQVQEVTSESYCSPEEIEMSANEDKNITLQEVRSGVPEYFDAFVCYIPSDFHFVQLLIRELEGKHRLKLCICNRDLMPGTSKYTAMAKLISERCKKVIVVLSEKFATSPECDFQTKFAQSLSPGAKTKKVIPVVIEYPFTCPDTLSFITPVVYAKCDLAEWFWERLARALLEESYSSYASDSQWTPMANVALTSSGGASKSQSSTAKRWADFRRGTSSTSSSGSRSSSSSLPRSTSQSSSGSEAGSEETRMEGAASFQMPAPARSPRKKKSRLFRIPKLVKKS